MTASLIATEAAPRLLLGTNRIGQLLMSTPALSGGMMLVRAEHDLFAIGK